MSLYPGGALSLQHQSFNNPALHPIALLRLSVDICVNVCVYTALGFEPLEVWHKSVCLKFFFFFFFRGWAVNCTREHYPATELSVSEGVSVPLIYYFQTKPDHTWRTANLAVYCTLRRLLNTGIIKEGEGGLYEREGNHPRAATQVK